MELEISELDQKFTENSFKDVSMSELSSQIALKACSSLQLIGFGKGFMAGWLKVVGTWNLLVSSYVQNRLIKKARDLFCQMKSVNLRFELVTLLSVLSTSKQLELGKVVHCIVLETTNNLMWALRAALLICTPSERIDEAR
ncbi:hypothetical protein HHK36_032761 [Tetracentron sinense]|uniref:Pentatricopeptide repeat-containing protein n=1 Tax=Tetracentron sinense TaxID=13715 RepID=A0A834Y6V7_TETSI|nr:hypothetical protein HHK36_032761 [Tetracentron sinense]